jgi:hypothetical protein
MSTYEWEAGTITIPSSQWAGFRKGLLTAWNSHLDTVLTTAKRAHKAAVTAGKGKRGETRTKAMKAAVARECGGRIGEYGDFEGGRGGNDAYNATRDLYETVTNLLWAGWGTNAKFQSPKKKDLPFRPVSKDGNVDLGEASVTFNNARRTVNWDVPENNHACDAARDHWFAKKLFTALGRINWTRGSGGTIIGNNEYNENEHGRRGDDYTVGTYRMETAADKKAKAARRSSYGGYSSYGSSRRY